MNKGNFYRIQSAFKYGARQLGRILLRPRDRLADDICKYFGNSYARREYNCRISFRSLAQDFDDESLAASLSSLDELCSEYDLPLKPSDSDLDNNSNGTEHRPVSELRNDLKIDSIRNLPLEMASETCCSTDGVFMLRKYGHVDNDGFVPSNSTLRNGQSDFNSSCRCGYSVLENHCWKSRCCSSKSAAENGSFLAHRVELACNLEKFASNHWLEKVDESMEMNNTHHCHIDNAKVVGSADPSSTPKPANLLENATFDSGESDSMSSGGDSEAFDPLADLTGDYDSHVRSLLCGHLCHGFSSSVAGVCSSPSSSFQAVKKRTLDIVPSPSHLLRTSHLNSIYTKYPHNILCTLALLLRYLVLLSNLKGDKNVEELALTSLK